MTIPSDIAGLSERLNDAEGVGACLSGDPQFIKALCKEAATALDSLSARVKELEAQSWKYLQEVGVQAREVIRAEQQRDEAYERAALQGWRTIDSAPKDGTEVLLWFPFTPDKPHWSHPTGFVFLAKWWISDGIDEDRWVDPDDCEDLGSTPTHWQPLPAPPLTAASDGEVG